MTLMLAAARWPLLTSSSNSLSHSLAAIAGGSLLVIGRFASALGSVHCVSGFVALICGHGSENVYA